MIAIITYDHPHRKTQDMVQALLLHGYKIHLILLPWKERPQRKVLYQHRPGTLHDVDPRRMCYLLNITYSMARYDNLNEHLANTRYDHIMIAGAGLLPDEVVDNHKIINIHPGYLPNVRGLDALKWAILEGQPVGVTSHYIDRNTDQGVLIDRRMIPVYYYDTFHLLAQRVYEHEIKMSVTCINSISRAGYLPIDDGSYEVHARMPLELEPIMMDRFDKLRKSKLW